MRIIKGEYNKDIKVKTQKIDDLALAQLYLLSNNKIAKGSQVRVMPDIQGGKGCVVGLTMTLSKDNPKVSPALVGVDIGCGVSCYNLGDVDIDLNKLSVDMTSTLPTRDVKKVKRTIKPSYSKIKKLKCFKDLGLKDTDKFIEDLGSLGSGNHFVEIGVDSNNDKWLTIHSGSRALGYKVASYYEDLARTYHLTKIEDISKEKKIMIKKLKKQGKHQEIQGKIKDFNEKIRKDLNKSIQGIPCLSERQSQNYLYDMKIVQDYAKTNRKYIKDEVFNLLGIRSFKEHIESFHNYIDLDSYILRKGAISSKKGERLVIPLNMKEGVVIGRGLGNKEWNVSAPHGLGRHFSRRYAKETISFSDFKESMQGIVSPSIVKSNVDESIFAYKDKDEVLSLIDDLLVIEDVIKPIFNFKG